TRAVQGCVRGSLVAAVPGASWEGRCWGCGSPRLYLNLMWTRHRRTRSSRSGLSLAALRRELRGLPGGLAGARAPGGGPRWCRVGDRVGACSQWKRPCAFPRRVDLRGLALPLPPTRGGQGRANLPRLPADAERRVLQSRCAQAGAGAEDGESCVTRGGAFLNRASRAVRRLGGAARRAG